MTLSDSSRQNMIGVSARKLRTIAQIATSRTIHRSRKISAVMSPMTERLALVGNLVVALDENDVAAPGVLEADLIDDKLRVIARIGILQDDARIVRAAGKAHQHHAGAVLERDDCRERLLQVAQPVPIEMRDLGLQASRVRAFEKLRDRDLLTGQHVIVHELRHRKMDAAVARDDDKAIEPGSVARSFRLGKREVLRFDLCRAVITALGVLPQYPYSPTNAQI